MLTSTTALSRPCAWPGCRLKVTEHLHASMLPGWKFPKGAPESPSFTYSWSLDSELLPAGPLDLPRYALNSPEKRMGRKVRKNGSAEPNLLRRNPQGGSWQEKGAAVLHSRKLMGQEAGSPGHRIRELSAAVFLFGTYPELLNCHTTSLFQQAVHKIASFLSLKSCHHTIWKIQVWNLAEKLWHARMHQHFLDASPVMNWANQGSWEGGLEWT